LARFKRGRFRGRGGHRLQGSRWFDHDRGRFRKERCDKGFFGRRFDLEMKWLFRLSGAGGGFGMTPAHDGGVKTFLDYFTCAGLDDGLAAQNRGPMRLLIEIGLDSIDLVLTEQARVGMCMSKFETSTTLQNLVD
jgi:hypothetical protein